MCTALHVWLLLYQLLCWGRAGSPVQKTNKEISQGGGSQHKEGSENTPRTAAL